jgi:hypothetical protein
VRTGTGIDQKIHGSLAAFALAGIGFPVQNHFHIETTLFALTSAPATSGEVKE